jgi:hypothetical protein
MSHYERWSPAQPVLALVEDVHRQVAVYNNILEELKHLDVVETRGSESTGARNIREQYENLGLVPEGFLPNPSAEEAIRYVGDKLHVFARGLIQVMHDYGARLLRELEFQPGATATLQVQIGWTPALTVGVERTA